MSVYRLLLSSATGFFEMNTFRSKFRMSFNVSQGGTIITNRSPDYAKCAVGLEHYRIDLVISLYSAVAKRGQNLLFRDAFAFHSFVEKVSPVQQQRRFAVDDGIDLVRINTQQR